MSASRSYGKGAAILSVGIGVTGLITYAYFALASHSLAKDEYGRISLLWSAVFIVVSVPREPLWRGLNMARGAYLKDFGNTPGHINHWSKRSFVAMLSCHGSVEDVRSPFPWTMVLVHVS